eukprot:366390-Chlamydomonas_euryale.AAC.2
MAKAACASNNAVMPKHGNATQEHLLRHATSATATMLPKPRTEDRTVTVSCQFRGLEAFSQNCIKNGTAYIATVCLLLRPSRRAETAGLWLPAGPWRPRQ